MRADPPVQYVFAAIALIALILFLSSGLFVGLSFLALTVSGVLAYYGRKH
jgi:hypothetical protein